MSSLSPSDLKFLRHWKLGLFIDLLLFLLVAGPIWATITTPDNLFEAWVEKMTWWPWVAAVLLGMLVWYAICDDQEAIELVFKMPGLLLGMLVLIGWLLLGGYRKLKEQDPTLSNSDRANR